MPYQALAMLMLISAPSDISDGDLAVVKRTISQWNLAMGRASNLVVLPVSWSEHAVAEFGERPQAVLNEQIVDSADMALALFADRLGTPTGEADSGTLEEVDRLVEAGKPVSVLVNRAARELSSQQSLAERQRLEVALEALRKRAIVLEYRDDAQLAAHLTNMLSRAATRVEDAVETFSRPAQDDEAIGVWPRITRENRQRSDSRGRLKTEATYRLVLENETGRPVENVTFRLDDEGETGLQILDRAEPVRRLPPKQSVEYVVLAYLGSGTQTECTVTWNFPGEEPRETTATVRL